MSNITNYFRSVKTPLHKNNRRASTSTSSAATGAAATATGDSNHGSKSSSPTRKRLPRSNYLFNNDNDNEIAEVSNDAFFSDPVEQHDEDEEEEEMNEDVNDDYLNKLTAQYTQTVFDEEEDFDRTTNLSQEDLYECDFGRDTREIKLGLAQSGDSDDNRGDMVDIQHNPEYKGKRQKLKDTEDQVWLGNVLMFKKHDLFEHPTKTNYVYKIEKLFKRLNTTGSEKGCKKEKMATCTLFRRREDTLLGDCLKEYEFVKYNHSVDIPLKKLGNWKNVPEPVTNLYYEDNNLQQQSHGFNVVFLKPNPNALTEEEKEVIKKNKQAAVKKRLEFNQSQKGHFSSIKPKRPTVFEAFAGCGGMTIGFTKAGFDVLWAVENNDSAAHSHKEYHRDCRVYGEDIVIFMEKLKKGLKDGDPEYTDIKPDHVHGSTPCQGFSSANIYGGKNDERNNECTKHFIELVRVLKPKKSVSFENVTGILARDNIHYLQMLVSELIRLGFNARVQVLNSARCGGDAQERNRVFVTAWRCELSTVIPRPVDTHSHSGGDLPKVRTAADAIGDLVNIEPCGGEGRVRWKGEDGKWSDVIHNHTMGNNDINKVEDELVATAPARTIRRQRPVKHYSKSRCLTVRERARLQSFPDDFIFRGKLINQCDQIGNAVPIGLATEVAKVIWDSCYSL